VGLKGLKALALYRFFTGWSGFSRLGTTSVTM